MTTSSACLPSVSRGTARDREWRCSPQHSLTREARRSLSLLRHAHILARRGGVAERPKAAVLKTATVSQPSRVRIPSPPPTYRPRLARIKKLRVNTGSTNLPD